MPEPFKIGDRVVIRKSASVTTPQAQYIQANRLACFVEVVNEQTDSVFIQVYERGVRYFAILSPDALWFVDSDEARQEAE